MVTPADSIDFDPALHEALIAAQRWLEEQQLEDGSWAGILESNACIEAEWLLAFHLLGYEFPDSGGLIRGILDRQRQDGSWETYHDAADGDINATVECYAALRASGFDAADERLERARAWIVGHGGLSNTRVFTRYWLAMLGEWPWEQTPNLPPEVIHIPSWFPVNIYSLACWARATLVPLCVLSARRFAKPLPEDRRLDELFPDGRQAMDYRLPKRTGIFSWGRFFLVADRVLNIYQRLGITLGRASSIQRCLEWIVQHQDADGAWGGIQPPWIYGLLALHAEGYPLTQPTMQKGLAALDTHWSYKRGNGTRIQASESSVWDTILSLLAMLDSGRDYSDSASIQRAVSWVLDQQVLVPGDWSVNVKGVQPGGWAFERANVHYPDVDDTAVALLVLARLRGQFEDPERLDRAIERGADWMIGMQSSNGGWAAFDKDNDLDIITSIPFCDFGEALDPPSADVTAHALEALGALGRDSNDPVIKRGLRFLYSEQEPSGSWFGRWGVNHIYGTAAVLTALRAVGEDMNSEPVRRAVVWLASLQNRDGGWGESCASYMDTASMGKGSSTASQTGWALMALLAADCDAFQQHVRQGVKYLTSAQSDGTWHEPEYTGTGFPGYGVGARTNLDKRDLEGRLGQGRELQRGFMINYNMYRHYFPLMALGRARDNVLPGDDADVAGRCKSS